MALALASTSLAYLIYFRLIAELGAPSALTVTFLVPVFGVLWGALFLGEDLHLGTLLGGTVILLSVGLATGALGPRAASRRTGAGGARAVSRRRRPRREPAAARAALENALHIVR